MIKMWDYISGEVREMKKDDLEIAKDVLKDLIELSARLNDGYDCVAVEAYNPEIQHELQRYAVEVRGDEVNYPEWQSIASYKKAYAYYSWGRMNNGNEPLSFDIYMNRVPQNEAEHIAELYHFV